MNMCNESMVYLNKVFSNQIVKSCPLMTEICVNADNFNQQFSFIDEHDCGCGCGCGCSCNSGCLDMDDDLNFVIECTEVIISEFDLVCPQELYPCNVTVDGMPVDGLEFFNQRYMAGTSDLMTRMSDCTCIEKGLPTKGYFLICNAGPWKAKLTIVIHGSVFGCGTCKRFKLCLTTKNDVCVNIPGSSTFAASSICLPCTTGGIAPIINFSFGASGSLLNPCITLDHCGQCNVQLTGCLIVEPQVEIEVTRQTLFNTTAESVNIPCDDLEKCRECSGHCGSEREEHPVPVHDKCCSNGSHTEGPKGCNTKSVCCQFNGNNGYTY